MYKKLNVAGLEPAPGNRSDRQTFSFLSVDLHFKKNVKNYNKAFLTLTF